MKRLCALCLVSVLVIGCFAGCGGNKTDSVSSTASTDGVTVEAWNQSCPEPVPENKIYTVYSTPTEGVKNGVAADNGTDIVAVENIEKLCFEYEKTNHTNSTSESNVKRVNAKEYSAESFVLEVDGLEYEARYVETASVSATYTFPDTVREYNHKFDKYTINNCIDGVNETDYYNSGTVFIERATGNIFYFELVFDDAFIELFEDEKVSENEAKAHAEESVRQFFGGKIPEGFDVEPIDLQHQSKYGCSVVYNQTLGGFKTECQIRVDVNEVGFTCRFMASEFIREYIDAVDSYGIESVVKASDALNDCLDNVTVKEGLINFDKTGRLYYRVISDLQYSHGCWCSHSQQYCINIVKASENNADARFKILDTKGNTVITENHIEQASVGDGTINGQYCVELKLDRTGTELLKYVTSQSIGEILPFYLDGELIFEPTVVATIEDGEVHITVKSKEEAERIYEGISSAMHGEEK